MHLAAPGPARWIPRLLPAVYDWQPELNSSGQRTCHTPTSAGLIGSLPLLISLAAFSAPQASLVQTLTGSIAPGVWRPHTLDSGRTSTPLPSLL